MYDKPLADSGFCLMTEFLEDWKGSSEKRKRKSRRQNITWFNPLYSQNVSTSIGRRFCTLIRKHFPRNSKLSKIFNTNTLKLNKLQLHAQYGSCDQSTQQLDPSGWEDHQVGKNYASGRSCNFRVKEDCPLKGTCQVQSVMYKPGSHQDDKR